jgi:hypothetical protein
MTRAPLLTGFIVLAVITAACSSRIELPLDLAPDLTSGFAAAEVLGPSQAPVHPPAPRPGGSPSATPVHPPSSCGAKGQTCCKKTIGAPGGPITIPVCNAGLSCEPGLICKDPPPPPVCGADGQICCGALPNIPGGCNSGEAICFSWEGAFGRCHACGDIGQPVCPINQCRTGVPKNGSCVPHCGSDGEASCGGKCDAGLTPARDVRKNVELCTPCGKTIGQPCCSPKPLFAPCAGADLQCEPSNHWQGLECVACGGANQTCCGVYYINGRGNVGGCRTGACNSQSGRCPLPAPPQDPPHCGIVPSQCCIHSKACKESGAYCKRDTDSKYHCNVKPTAQSPASCSGGSAVNVELCARCPSNVDYALGGIFCSADDANTMMGQMYPGCEITDGLCPAP